MTTQQHSEHDWFSQQIAAYLAGGLTGGDLSRFRAHADQCEACAAELARLRRTDADLQMLFDSLRPDAGFEDRVIAKLRATSPRGKLPAIPFPTLKNLRQFHRPHWIHPAVARVAGGMAAAILLGGFGYLGTNALQNGGAQRLAMSSPDSQTKNITALRSIPRLGGSVRGLQIDQKSIFNGRMKGQLTDRESDLKSDGFANHGKTGHIYRYLDSWPTTEDRASEHRDVGASGNLGADDDQVQHDGRQKNARADLLTGGATRWPASTTTTITPPLTLDETGKLQSSFAGKTKIAAGTLSLEGIIVNGTGRSAAPDLTIQLPKDGLDIASIPQPLIQPPSALFYKPGVTFTGGISALGGTFVTGDDFKADFTKVPRTGAAGSTGLDGTRVIVPPTSASPPAGPTAQSPVVPAPVAPAPSDTTAPPVTPAPPAPPTPLTPPAPSPAQSQRRIIRHGTMDFEVDSFDSAYLQISKIVGEETGFIATTNSDKLANGKVSGTITVRVPPEHLDTLVLKLRGLGDLKGQKITSDDVTREFTDLESSLRAAHAMEDRLLDIVKTGKGDVKELLAAEKEMGVWREKVEKLTGQINYYSNLIALSTLELTLTEHDIRQASQATETETINAGLETEDVEKARNDAIKAIEDAKGRLIQSDLKQFEAGQLAAQIVADVPAEAAGPLLDRIKQLGRVARLDIGRQQSTPNGQPVIPGAKTERAPTRISLNIYNLANVAPRQTTNVAMGAEDVEKVYHDTIDRIAKAQGRVVNSSLNRDKPDQIQATINFETPAAQSDVVLSDLRAMGEVLHLTVTENPDAANVTAAKHGFVMTLVSLATVPPREVITRTLMPSGSTGDAYRAVLAAAQTANARIIVASLQEHDNQSAAGNLTFDVSRAHLVDVEKAISAALGEGGRVLNKQVARSADTEHTVDSKVQLALVFASSDVLSPRQTVTRTLAVSDVPSVYNAILSAAQAGGARIALANLDESNRQAVYGKLDVILPVAGADALEKAITDAKAGIVSRSVARSADMDNTTESRIELRLTILDLDQLPPRQTTTLQIEAGNPEKAAMDLQAAALAAGGRVVEQTMSKDGSAHARVVVDVPLHSGGDLVDRARALGTVKQIVQTKDPAVPDAAFVSARLEVTISDLTQLPPRQITTMTIESSDPEKSMRDLQGAAAAANGRVVVQTLSKDSAMHAHVIVDVPQHAAGELLDRARSMGTMRNIEQAQDPSVPDSEFASAQIDVNFVSESAFISEDHGIWSTLRKGLGTSVRGLMVSLQFIIVGLCLILPWAVLVWGGWRLSRRYWKKPGAVVN